MQAPAFYGYLHRDNPLRSRFMQRLGAASFCFFLVKGLLWMLAPFVFMWFT
jgi:hypothetical protein